MNSYKRMVRSQMISFLILLIMAAASFSSVAQAQIYPYGRADFQSGNNNNNTPIVIVADFNGDGRPDVAVSDSYNNWISILLGTSNGGFVAKSTYATGANPTALVAADFNGDKKLDLAVVNANSGTISILLGNGDGTFQSRTDYPVGDNPVGIVAADFNGDGNIDLATIATNDSSVAILLGDGHGGFEVHALIPVASAPTLLAKGDVNGDGKIDLITCNNSYSSATITALVSNGDGTFKQVNSQGVTDATSLAVGDFNSDGKLDVIIGGYGPLYLALGNGDGSFQNPVAIPNAPNEYGWTPIVGDFNHDNKLDLALNGIFVMLGKGDGTFQSPVEFPAAAVPMAVVDVNGDGQPDIVAVASSGVVSILLGHGDGIFMDIRSVPIASTPYSPGVGVAADFNGDGKLDLAVAEQTYSNGQVSVQLGNGNSTFKQPIVSSMTTGNTSLILASDFNGDGKTDVAFLDGSGYGFQVLLGAGDGTFGTPVDTPLNYPIFSVAAGDFNRDGKVDLVAIANTNSPSVNIYLSNGDGTFSLGQSYIAYPNSYVTVADVNGDGNPDLIVDATSYGSQYNLLVFLGNGDGTFQNPILGPADYYSSQAVVADFNGDGKLDIVVGTSGYQSGGIAFHAGNGDGTFETAVYSDAGFQFVGPLLAADFNGDGKLDVAGVSSYYGVADVLAGNGDGTFGFPEEFDEFGQYNLAGAFAGDFNSDGVSELGMPGISSSGVPFVLLYVSTPAPNLFPKAFNFGRVQVGKTSSPKKVTLTNSGNAKLKITRITASGDFHEQNNCGKSIAVGKNCTIQVSFKPTVKGLRTGEVSIADNGPGSPQRVHLEGTGK
jgi:hypothetical protein